MTFKYACVVLICFTVGAAYYLIGDENEGVHQASLFLGACNLSMFALYLYATLSSSKSKSDYKFKLVVLISVLIYAAINLLINIRIYNGFETQHPARYPEDYVVFVSVAVLALMVMVLFQIWKVCKALHTKKSIREL
jgi:uncharacterized membrane protein YcjF (UPF0283 family)